MTSEKQILTTGFIFLIILTLLFYFTVKDFLISYKDTSLELEGISKIIKIYNLNIKLKALRGISQLNEKQQKILKSKLFIDEEKIKNEIYSSNDKEIIDLYNQIANNVNFPKFEIFKLYTKIIEKLQHKTIDLATTYHLIFDKDTNNYYLMNLFIFQLPQLIEIAGKIRGLGTGYLTKNLNNQKIKILLKLNVTDFYNKINTIKFFISRLNPTIQNEFEERIEEILNKFYNLNSIITCILNNEAVISPDKYFLKVSIIINKINLLFILSKNYLIKNLSTRKSNLYFKITLLSLIYVILFLTVIFLIKKFYSKLHDEKKKIEKEKVQNNLISSLRDEYMKNLHLKEACEISLNYIINYFKSLNGIIYIFDDKNEKLYLASVYGVNPEKIPQTLGLHDNVVSQTLVEGKLKIIDLKKEICAGSVSIASSKLVILPMIDFGKKIGVVQLLFDEINFSFVDINFLKTTISLMATYIHKIENDEEINNYLNLIDKHVLISKTDVKGKITEVSQFFCDLTGYSKEELIGNTHSILKSGETSLEVYKNLWDTIKSGKVWKGELKNKTKDGKFIWLYTIISPEFDINGNIIGYTAIRYDITDRKKVEELAITDSLTKLYNRRFFDEIFPRELKISKRIKSSLVFSIVDIDHFKQFNDIYGHQKGDEILKRVADVLKNNLKRPNDFVFRIGGEEFALIFYENDKDKVKKILEKIRREVENLKIEHKGNSVSKFLTISIGAYIIKPEDILTTDEIFRITDDALYKAKNSGRNRVVLI